MTKRTVIPVKGPYVDPLTQRRYIIPERIKEHNEPVPEAQRVYLDEHGLPEHLTTKRDEWAESLRYIWGARPL